MSRYRSRLLNRRSFLHALSLSPLAAAVTRLFGGRAKAEPIALPPGKLTVEHGDDWTFVGWSRVPIATKVTPCIGCRMEAAAERMGPHVIGFGVHTCGREVDTTARCEPLRIGVE